MSWPLLLRVDDEFRMRFNATSHGADAAGGFGHAQWDDGGTVPVAEFGSDVKRTSFGVKKSTDR